MSSCERVRPVLYRVAEGEANPGETLRVARHLPDCTACRILLAREVRLAEMLEQLDDPLRPEERFVEDVMTAIANDPAPPRRVPRAVKLGGLSVLLLAAGAVASRFAPVVLPWGGSSVLPGLGSDGPDGKLDAAAGVARLLLVALDRMLTAAPPALADLHLTHHMALSTAAPAATLVLVLAGAIALATRNLTR
jgi:predicted anti-sigma-YlaC factor YlaD